MRLKREKIGVLLEKCQLFHSLRGSTILSPQLHPKASKLPREFSEQILPNIQGKDRILFSELFKRMLVIESPAF